MSPRTSRPLRSAAFTALCGFALPARAQLPVVLPEAPEPIAEAAPPPAAEPAPPAAERAPLPVAPDQHRAPAKAEVIGFGQHPYADDDDDDVPTTLAPRRVWYGWQTLVVDGAALSAVLLGVAMNSGASSSGDSGGAVGGVGLLGYWLGPGIVHFAHRNPGRGFASFGVRLGMPLAGAFLGASFSSNCDGYRCEEDGAVAGALLGMAGAIAIDAAVFAYDDRRPAATRAAPRLVPLAVLQPGRAWFGVGGAL